MGTVVAVVAVDVEFAIDGQVDAVDVQEDAVDARLRMLEALDIVEMELDSDERRRYMKDG